ncbi:hypothetical protein INR49_000173 [Caranx melampygus]|nr:hypothetical protein INR49_000173 [Caranx melampygus]
MKSSFLTGSGQIYDLRVMTEPVVSQCEGYCPISSWSVEELRLRLASLDPQMEQEIEEIRQRYQAKRQPIMDAIEAKKRRQQNF